MKTVRHIRISDIIPDRDTILKAQGIAPGARVKSEIVAAADDAVELLSRLAHPIAIVSDISKDDFAPIFEGMGRNDNPSPIEDIYRRADRLMLFAATVGNDVCDKITELFAANEFVIGNALDRAASESTDRISNVLERSFEFAVSTPDSDTIVFAYSPGYCGWHISTQKILFDVLRPEEIGITLRDSFLMEPLKSISGVLVAGHKEIHLIDNSYPFCADCENEPCRARMAAIGDGRQRQSRETKS